MTLVEHIIRIIKAFGYSLAGLKSAFCSEPAFVIEVFAFIIFTPLTFLLPFSLAFKALLMGSLFLVLIAELANSAIEAVVDRISLEHHPLSKKAKDIGSAVVLLSLINAAVIWAIGLWSLKN